LPVYSIIYRSRLSLLSHLPRILTKHAAKKISVVVALLPNERNDEWIATQQAMPKEL
jgi:hypothetical protein